MDLPIGLLPIVGFEPTKTHNKTTSPRLLDEDSMMIQLTAHKNITADPNSK